MLMPDRIDARLLAPCGVNCFVCYRHLVEKKPCQGCLASDENKPQACRTCAIEECCVERGYTRCFECPEFPCKESKRMERNYKKYGVSLIGNGSAARDSGLEAFMDEERARWTCPECGGAVSQHSRICSACGKESE